MNSTTISVVILTRNEEKNIEKCIQALGFAKEIVVVDDYSQDKTLDIIEKLRKKDPRIQIFQRRLQDNFATQRNFGLEKATGEWIFFVDADEIVSQSLASEIISTLYQVPQPSRGFQIQRIDTMWGKRLLHGETGDIKLTRIARKDAGIWEGAVHEVWNITGPIGILKYSLYHYPHPTVSEFLKEINYYSTLRSQQLYDQKKKTSWWEIIAYPRGKFIVNYFLKRGFLDGTPGFISAMLMSFHSFLVRGKLWLLIHS